MEDLVDTEMSAAGAPGVSYAVVDGGDITSAGGHGVVRIGGDEAVTPDTPFLTGSISKSFTAMAVMQLVEAGKVDLDGDVSSYVDGFRGRPAGAITIRQLLSHTSGFSTLQGNTPADVSSGPGEPASRIDRAAEVVPANPPGYRWEYSNLNYEILGGLVEVVSGQEYQAHVAGHSLEPVGMDHSFVSDGEVHESMATVHTPWFGTHQPLPDPTTAEEKAAVVLVNAGSGLGFGETTDLRTSITARALGLEYVSEGARWAQKALFIGLVLLRGVFGVFSLWFPLLTTLAAAWAIFVLVPRVGGAPIATIRVFAPDFGLALVATAVTGVLWAVFRLGVGYTGRSVPDRRVSS